ncbi:MAG: efflux RND transporter permease subunit [Planctomycetota bacterium]
MKIAAFGVTRPVVANLVMLAIITAGVIFGTSLRREFFPEIRPNLVTVAAPYPGASPDEVESALAKKIEDAVEDLDDVKEINSTVSEGVARVTIEFAEGVDVDQKVQDVKREVDALQDLPEESDRIVVSKIEPNLPTINLSLFGDADESTMKLAIRQMKDDLESIDGMGDIGVTGVRRDEILIEVRPGALVEHRLSLPMISDRVRSDLRELPGGTLKGATSNVSVRTLGAEERAEQIRGIVVKAGDSGQVLRVRDIAEVTEGFADVQLRSRLNGKPAFSLTAYKVGRQDAVEIAEMVKAYAAGLRGEALDLSFTERIAAVMQSMQAQREHRSAVKKAQEQGRATPPEPDAAAPSPRVEAYRLGLARGAAGGVPQDAEVAVTTDLAKFIVGRLELLTRNALWGGLLVFLTLVVLLNWRVSFWVAMGLIISLLGTLAVMYFVDITLNLLSMFGLIVVLGLLVDDAIVVAENIAARHEQGENHIDSAINGTGQVGWPVVATVMTTICAFVPLALIQGQIGDFLEVLPVVVACALLVSLIECLFILPAHMSHSLRGTDKARAAHREGPLLKLELKTDRLRERLFQSILIPGYLRVLRLAIRFRYVSLSIALAAVMVSAGMVRGGFVEFIFFEDSDSETINGELRMPIGTPTAQTDEVLRRIEAVCLAQPEIQQVFASAGSFASLDGDSGSEQSHLGQVILEVMPVEEREAQGLRPSPEIIQSIRDELGPMPGVKSFRLEGVAGGPDGPPITITATGNDAAQLDRAVVEIKTLLAEYEGVENISDNADRGQRELRFEVRDAATELGFTTANVATQIRGAVFGLEPWTFAGDEEDVDVRVTLPESVRRSIAALESIELLSPAGDPVPLGEVVSVREEEGYATVRRLDGDRAVTITADVDRTSGANPEEITTQLRPRLRSLEASMPGIAVLERGRQEDVADSFSTLPIGMAVAGMLIYVVLAWLFASYAQPLVVMSAIPFATIGMIWGHFFLGYSLTFLSLIGFVALAGVVVNDSLILMEFYNEKRRHGLGVAEACVSAGRARLRAIMLTTITTVLGLTPLLLEESFQAKFLIPMGITISGGLISATVIILVILPCLLVIYEDISRVVRALWTGRTDSDDGSLLVAAPSDEVS